MKSSLADGALEHVAKMRGDVLAAWSTVTAHHGADADRDDRNDQVAGAR